jgi:hypothetical protein
MGDLYSEIGVSTDGTAFIHGWRYEAGTAHCQKFFLIGVSGLLSLPLHIVKAEAQFPSVQFAPETPPPLVGGGWEEGGVCATSLYNQAFPPPP